MPEGPKVGESFGAQFMLQEYSRIVDAYHDLHLQKSELIKFYLAFVSLPVSIVAIFLSVIKYVQPDLPLGSAEDALQVAGVYLSILLVFVGVAVLQAMLRIRDEQYLYVQTINGTRQYFKEMHGIEKKYLVLPSDVNEITFGPEELSGRAFWETMIIGSTTSMLCAFLSFETCRHFQLRTRCSVLIVIFVFVAVLVAHGIFVRRYLRAALKTRNLSDMAASSR